MADEIQVLYIDDEPGLIEIGKLFLENTGEFSVDTALSASVALDILNKKKYDAIVSDFQMPKMDGIELLKKVRSFDKNIPFILFTGRGREEIVIDAINNGADFYIQKGGEPIAQFAELAHKIRQSVLMRRTQVTIAEQEQRYHDLQNANDLIQSVAPDGHFLFVNQKWLDTLGYKEEELANLTIFDIIHEESIRHCMETFQQVISGENVGIIDATFRTRDGVKVYVEGMANCKLIDGVCQYTRGIFKNITDRKKAELERVQKNEDLNAAYEEIKATDEELRANYDELRKKEEAIRASEEQFRVLVELSLDGIIITDFLGKLLFANRAAGLIVDALDYEAMIGNKNVLDFVAPESKVDVLRDLGKVALGIDSYLVNYKLISQTKREVWVECIGKKISFRNSSAMLVSMRDVTERKLAEERVRESENKFSTLFKNSPVSLTLVSATDGTFIDVNDAFLRSTGYSRHEVVGSMAVALGIFADKSEYKRFSTVLRNQRTVHGMEMKCRIKNGEIRTCRFSSGIIMMDAKPHILSTVDDITEQKATELALQALVRSMVGTTGLDSLKKITENVSSWLGADCVMVGEIQPDRESVKVLSMLLDGKEVHDFSYTLKGTPCENVADKGFCLYPDNAIALFPESKDLVELKIRGYIGTPLRNSGGQVIGILCALSRVPLTSTPTIQEIMDIIAVKAAAEIERIQTEFALFESEEKYRTLFDSAGDVIFIHDMNGRILAFNTLACEKLGYTRPELMSMMVGEVDSQENALHAPARIARLKEQVHISFETVHRRKDGQLIPIEVSAKLITWEGQPAVMSICHDITERKRADEALHQANKKLNLLSSITRHDIKNQLLTLDGFATLLHKKITDPSFEHYFSRINRASNQITNMIQFTKEYEKIGVNAPTWQDIRILVEKAGRDNTLGQITLKNDLPANMEVYADPLIAKVFFNLIDNSVRHGGKITTIRFSLEERDGERIVVCEDDGDGVAPEEKERIFDLGFGKNTGFGLAISREILDITGITIKETGEPGKGARFEIAVPKNQFRSALTKPISLS